MTSRFGKRNRSSSKLDHSAYSPNPGEQSRRIKDLEKSLEEKDKTIAELQEKVKELSSELERRKEFTDVLTSERNALRQKNASLVGKLAELSRKQSVSSFTTLPSPPELPKRWAISSHLGVIMCVWNDSVQTFREGMKLTLTRLLATRKPSLRTIKPANARVHVCMHEWLLSWRPIILSLSVSLLTPRCNILGTTSVGCITMPQVCGCL